jgi:hypothetical protein
MLEGGSMEAELAGLATSGAATLVGLMVTDVWTQARERLARFFGRGAGEDASAAELAASQQELVAARAAGDEEAAADIEAAWRSRLRRALREDPAAADELRTLLAELAPATAERPSIVVHSSVTGGVHYGPVVQGQNLSHLTFHATPPPYPDGGPPGQ